MPKYNSLRTKLTLTIALAVLFTVVMVSLLSNLFINRQFARYISQRQQEKTMELASSLSQQYYRYSNSWDIDFIHTIGMYALYDGYIINVFDMEGTSIWDAQNHDMSACAQVMSDIKERMERKYPSVSGEFVSEIYPLVQNGEPVGSVEISYFGPFFLSENDFNFLQSLNLVLAGIALFSQFIAVLVGGYFAKRLSSPILRTVEAARQMADGDYKTQLEDQTGIRELNQLILSVNHLAATLDKLERLRKQLTADVAHELRTPLHTMGIQIESMIEGVWAPTPDRLRSCHEEIERIGALVKDLERLAEMESDNLRLEITALDYWHLIDKALENLEIEIKKKQLLIEKAGNALTIRADPARWYQVVYNLLTNAIKHTPAGGTIKLSTALENGCSVLSIEDTGCGIAENELSLIFERFYRTEKSRSRETGGSGIGLAIVKSIVDAHAGRIMVESKPKKGSVFTILLPQGPPQPLDLQ